MNRNNLEAYAQQARRDFIAAVTGRAAFYGLTAKSIEPIVEQGDVALIGAHAFSRNVAGPRKRLEEHIQRDGFEQVMDIMAYTWFNRFAAIRYMELHGYLDHGYRVLSHPEGQDQPEILEHAADVDLQGLDREKAVELKLDGSKDEELYRLLLMAQCNALHQAMPFLFERIGDETELLLPANLLHTDSLIRQLVEGIDESAWGQIEIIGWLYQFYISEKKGQVIGNVVASEDIPAATQLFTPNWIVKYLVQNSLGAQWLATYPHSSIRGQMDYYIEPAEQVDAVKAQLAAITPGTLNPESLTLIDPASGSGHILVEAYDLFKAIYLERGYQKRGVAQLILEKNLFGLDIDGRAAQLTGFALMMKGRADDRRLFERGVKLNVMALVDSTGFDAERLAQRVKLADYGLQLGDLTELKRLFEHATTFGSLIQVPEGLVAKLPSLKQLSEVTGRDLFVSDALKRLRLLVRQAEMLAGRYDAVVANPPYMGSNRMNPLIKGFAKARYPKTKSDLFSISMERFFKFGKSNGFIGLMTPFTWMFLKSYQALREDLVRNRTLLSLIQPEYHAFFDSAYVPLCTFVTRLSHITKFTAAFINLSDFYGADIQPIKVLEAIRNPACSWRHSVTPESFDSIPGCVIGYNIPEATLKLFASSPALRESYVPKQGLITGDNDRFLRFWHEVGIQSFSNPDEHDRRRWLGYQKGGAFRKWYGNHDYVVDWDNDGRAIRTLTDVSGKLRSRPQNVQYYFSEGASWTSLTVGSFALRYVPAGFIFDAKGPMCFPTRGQELQPLLALGNSVVMKRLLSEIAPTMDYSQGPVGSIPFLRTNPSSLRSVVDKAVAKTKHDWDSFENSWDFQILAILTASCESAPTLESSYAAWTALNRKTIAEMQSLEEENNRLFIAAYGLTDELTPDVPIEQITLTVNPAYRYGGKLTEEVRWTRFRQDTMKELVSYAIGCMMGRYSLDSPGLIYAHSGGAGFDPSRFTTFPADADGIVPLTDFEWFDDDACHRLIEFVSVAWDAARLEDNLAFLADNLSPRNNESSRETLRRYLCDSFFKDHLQTYRKRPIYWLFASGKQKAFQCLVYLHRYNEGTLARMRTEYVIPLQGRMASRVRRLEEDIAAAASTAHRKRLEKERTKLVKQQSELREFDEKLRHYADQRISLDLDDGVKVNYGKFGYLLAEVKAITGAKAD